jgi:hypothetical protein
MPTTTPIPAHQLSYLLQVLIARGGGRVEKEYAGGYGVYFRLVDNHLHAKPLPLTRSYHPNGSTVYHAAKLIGISPTGSRDLLNLNRRNVEALAPDLYDAIHQCFPNANCIECLDPLPNDANTVGSIAALVLEDGLDAGRCLNCTLQDVGAAPVGLSAEQVRAWFRPVSLRRTS